MTSKKVGTEGGVMGGHSGFVRSTSSKAVWVGMGLLWGMLIALAGLGIFVANKESHSQAVLLREVGGVLVAVGVGMISLSCYVRSKRKTTLILTPAILGTGDTLFCGKCFFTCTFGLPARLSGDFGADVVRVDCETSRPILRIIVDHLDFHDELTPDIRSIQVSVAGSTQYEIKVGGMGTEGSVLAFRGDAVTGVSRGKNAKEMDGVAGILDLFGEMIERGEFPQVDVEISMVLPVTWFGQLVQNLALPAGALAGGMFADFSKVVGLAVTSAVTGELATYQGHHEKEVVAALTSGRFFSPELGSRLAARAKRLRWKIRIGKPLVDADSMTL